MKTRISCSICRGVSLAEIPGDGSTVEREYVYVGDERLAVLGPISLGGTSESSLLVEDYFTDLDHLSLASHQPVVGGSWEFRYGTAEVAEGNARALTRQSNHFVATMDHGAADVEITTRIKAASNRYSGVVVRFSGGAFYMVSLAPYSSSGLRIHYWNGSSYSLKASVTKSIVAGQWYDLSVVVDGSTITGTVDGAQVSYASATANPSSTHHGIVMEHVYASYPDLEVDSYIAAEPGGIPAKSGKPSAQSEVSSTKSVVLVGDSFTDAAHTLLTNHSPEVGGAWVYGYGTGEVDGGALRALTVQGDFVATIDHTIPNVSITARIKAASGRFSGVVVRYSGGQYYMVSLAPYSSSGLRIHYYNGSSYSLKTSATKSITAGQWYDVSVVVNGPVIIGEVDGAQVVINDATINQSSTYHGLVMEHVYASYPDLEADSYTATSVDPAAGEEGDVHYYHNDHLGTPQALTDATGAIVWQADYEPFGKANILVEDVINNLRFPGQYYDAETGLHYNYFRDYSPGIGRYMESDPLGQIGGVNTFIYVSANPYGLSDRFGLLDDDDPTPRIPLRDNPPSSDGPEPRPISEGPVDNFGPIRPAGALAEVLCFQERCCGLSLCSSASTGRIVASHFNGNCSNRRLCCAYLVPPPIYIIRSCGECREIMSPVRGGVQG